MKKAWMFALLVIIGALIACGESTGSNAGSTPSNTQAANTPSKPVSWTTTHTFTGNGTKKTEVFQVGDTWKIKYTCQGMGQGIDGVLGVTVYGSDATPIDVAVNATCKDGKVTSDETTEHKGGSVYLDINGTGNWTVAVLEQK